MRSTRLLKVMILSLCCLIFSPQANTYPFRPYGESEGLAANGDVSPEANPSGDYAFSVPLAEIKDGNIGYSLSASYNSNVRAAAVTTPQYHSSGYLGLGWKLTESFIRTNHRSTVTYKDDKIDVMINGSYDELVTSDDEKYYLKKNPYVRVEKTVASNKIIVSWKLTYTDGTVYTFGKTSTSTDAASNLLFEGDKVCLTNQANYFYDTWYLKTIEDVTGTSRLTFTYSPHDVGSPSYRAATDLQYIENTRGDKIELIYGQKTPGEYSTVFTKFVKTNAFHLDRINQYVNADIVRSIWFDFWSKTLIGDWDERLLKSIISHDKYGNQINRGEEYEYNVDRSKDKLWLLGTMKKHRTQKGFVKEITYKDYKDYKDDIQYFSSDGITYPDYNKRYPNDLLDKTLDPRFQTSATTTAESKKIAKYVTAGQFHYFSLPVSPKVFTHAIGDDYLSVVLFPKSNVSADPLTGKDFSSDCGNPLAPYPGLGYLKGSLFDEAIPFSVDPENACPYNMDYEQGVVIYSELDAKGAKIFNIDDLGTTDPNKPYKPYIPLSHRSMKWMTKKQCLFGDRLTFDGKNYYKWDPTSHTLAHALTLSGPAIIFNEDYIIEKAGSLFKIREKTSTGWEDPVDINVGIDMSVSDDDDVWMTGDWLYVTTGIEQTHHLR
ncbi:MAG: hypothetical protein A2268_02025 [Candidatus Raymondbacteria bacterium RifOxyA12_full_50_37]|uniref:Uncharacterized protein n=1 Tax=Candidatus Raymondbacteria bacterium RIFOXYD12_FULL_49_13 TaxID=1817890 RepID=A0A1F7F513_UNCRA|nr:MAG: hypothetical protein A2268_02025 [Candidatus Raymondbacteria bacterium RifOxyA12_full_50_37]OGJ91312.1 MAG: hypothetical protein A2350_13310 [Candidatus Raymondbacteria bacterium RifOxyB12_full_50_8]OGJ92206.1 MAG: hypothetical protein A2248_10855 [Candidatus Raymondbacteria bacterium RIFOXYA2_FULL_49_16]OGJ98532.1 MAG: hypothetical protein A2453_06655 [Candidatus Raymondbacteria bacterium RIFOXYC2_FULL_50_21]OGK01606.1 MAG: hypothetical protein A2519_06075 [Candidatus Raymondbacteria b